MTPSSSSSSKVIAAAFGVAALLGIVLFSLHWIQPLQNCGETIQAFRQRALISSALAGLSLVLAIALVRQRTFWGSLALFLLGVTALLYFLTPFFC